MSGEITMTVVIEMHINAEGQIALNEFQEFWKDGELLSRDKKPHSLVVMPDEEYKGNDEEVKRVIAAVHTPEKKVKFKKFKEGKEKENRVAFETMQITAREENATNAAVREEGNVEAI